MLPTSVLRPGNRSTSGANTRSSQRVPGSSSRGGSGVVSAVTIGRAELQTGQADSTGPSPMENSGAERAGTSGFYALKKDWQNLNTYARTNFASPAIGPAAN